MNIKERIKFYQEQRNWSLNHLAMESDLSPATVLNWFNKNATPSIQGIESICRAFGITISEFFNEGDIAPTYLSNEQKKLLGEWDLLHKDEKTDFLSVFSTVNRIRKNSHPM